MNTSYCLGFAFTDGWSVALIKKARPLWQAGKLNGIGGVVNEYESACVAMIREFKEETTMQTTEEDWDGFLLMEFPDTKVQIFVFRAFFESLAQVRTPKGSDEPVSVVHYSMLDYNDCIYNLRTLIPMALDRGFRLGSFKCIFSPQNNKR